MSEKSENKKQYSAGNRTYCGIEFHDNLIKNQKLDNEIITPTTKDKDDLPISYDNIIERELLSKEDLDYIYSICEKLYTCLLYTSPSPRD